MTPARAFRGSRLGSCFTRVGAGGRRRRSPRRSGVIPEHWPKRASGLPSVLWPTGDDERTVCRRFRSISDDKAGDDQSAEPLTRWPSAETFAPTLPLQRIRAPVFALLTVVTVGPVTLIERNIFPEPHPAAKPTATSARARIAFTVSLYTPLPGGCQRDAQGSFRNTRPAERAASFRHGTSTPTIRTERTSSPGKTTSGRTTTTRPLLSAGMGCARRPIADYGCGPVFKDA